MKAMKERLRMELSNRAENSGKKISVSSIARDTKISRSSLELVLNRQREGLNDSNTDILLEYLGFHLRFEKKPNRSMQQGK